MISQSNILIGFNEGVKLLKDFELFKCKNVSTTSFTHKI